MARTASFGSSVTVTVNGRVPGFGTASRLYGGTFVGTDVAGTKFTRAFTIAIARRGRVLIEAQVIESEDVTPGDTASAVELLRSAVAHYDAAT